MALMKCPECGRMISDMAVACPGCGMPRNVAGPDTHSSFRPIRGADIQPLQPDPRIPRCPRCSGTDIEYTMEAVEHKTKGRAEVRKKSVITRAGNAMGRGIMIGATAGLWALTPKKSQFSEKQTGTTKIINKKFAICQNCGHSWKV